MKTAKNLKVRGEDKIRVLIADKDGTTARSTLNFLNQHGFEARLCVNANDAKTVIVQWRPKVLLVDLLLPEANGFEMLRFCQQEPSLKNSPISVMIMSGHNTGDNVREAYQRGARDYISRPFSYQDLLNRIVFHCRNTREIEPNQKETNDHALKIADVVVTQALQKLPMEEMLHQLTQMAALKTGGIRCSIIHTVTHDRGVVLGSNDKRDIAGFSLDLKKYPEVQLVAHTGKIVVIDNLDESRVLSQIKSSFKELQFNSMIVCPLYYHHRIFGVMSIRMSADEIRIPNSKIHFAEFIGKVTSLYLSTLDAEKIGQFGLVSVPD